MVNLTAELEKGVVAKMGKNYAFCDCQYLYTLLTYIWPFENQILHKNLHLKISLENEK